MRRSSTVPPGTVLDRFVLPVDASKAREAAIALKTTDPAWTTMDPRTLRGKVVPPTFSTTSSFYWQRPRVFGEQLGMDFSRGLHGSSTWDFERPLRVGDTLVGDLTFVGEESKVGRRGGDMRKLTARCSLRDEEGGLAVTETFSFLETTAWPTVAPAATPVPSPDPRTHQGHHRVLEPLTRTDIVRYAGACGDFSEVHHDEQYAAAHGLPTVFAMGLLQAGMIGLHATETDDRELRRLHLVLRERVWPGDALVLSAEPAPDRTRLTVITTEGRVVVEGTAEFALE